MPEFRLSFFLLGCLGGVLPDILRYVRTMRDPEVPPYLGRWNFWVGVVLLGLLGGLTTWILDVANAKDALIYGYTSPAVISQLVAAFTPAAPAQPVVRGVVTAAPQKGFNLLKWWRS